MITYEGPSRLSGTCGASVVYSFRQFSDKCPWPGKPPSWWKKPVAPRSHLGNANLHQGAGWLTAGFIPNAACKEAYAILAKRYKIVFQSPRRRNNNSDNQFIFVVYDTKPASSRGKRPSWVGKRSGAPKPQALIDWEATSVDHAAVDDSEHKWPF